MGVGDLYTLCAELLAACEEAIAAAPGGPIGRSFVAPGPPAWDCCPQLTVHAGGPAEGDTAPLDPPLQPGHRHADAGAVNLVQMTATVIRCVPTVEALGVFPPAAAMDAAAQQTLGDVWAIWNHLRSRYRARTIFTRPDGERREVFFDPAAALNPAGGCAGWEIPVRVQMDGYQT